MCGTNELDVHRSKCEATVRNYDEGHSALVNHLTIMCNSIFKSTCSTMIIHVHRLNNLSNINTVNGNNNIDDYNCFRLNRRTIVKSRVHTRTHTWSTLVLPTIEQIKHMYYTTTLAKEHTSSKVIFI